MRVYGTIIKTIAVVLLVFNGIGALYGGSQLIMYPDGSSIHLSMDLLRHSGFNNYLIPGIILFIVNGLFSLFTLAALLFNNRYQGLLMVFQGIALISWILIQVLLIRTQSFWQLLLGFVGIALMILGSLFLKLRWRKDS